MQNLLHQVPPETPPPSTKTVSKNGQKTPLRWVMLLAGLLSYLSAGGIFVFVPPAQIQNLVFPGSYFPLIMALGIGHFMIGIFFSKNTWFGVACAVTGSLLLIFRLNQVLTWWFAIACFSPIVFTKLLLTFQKHKR